MDTRSEADACALIRVFMISGNSYEDNHQRRHDRRSWWMDDHHDDDDSHFCHLEEQIVREHLSRRALGSMQIDQKPQTGPGIEEVA